MAVWKSVEYVELSITSATTVTQNLTKSQDETQCTPWYSNVATVTHTDQNQDRLPHIWFDNSAGTPRVNAQLPAWASGTLRVQIFVVEWDSSINVQQISVTSFTGVTATPSFTSVGAQNQAFLKYSYAFSNPPASDDDWDDAGVQCRFNGASVTQALLSRRASGGDVDGTLYVVDCDSGEFTVDHQEIDITTASAPSGTATISSTVMADSFIIHSYETGEADDDMLDAMWHADLQDTTTIRIRRGDTSPATQNATSTHSIAIVECQNNEWDVQRNGQLKVDTAATVTDTITSIDQARSFVQMLHGYGFMSDPRCDSTVGGTIDDIMSGVDFSAGDTVRKRSRTVTATLDEYISYEAVQFTAAGGIIPKIHHQRHHNRAL